MLQFCTHHTTHTHTDTHTHTHTSLCMYIQVTFTYFKAGTAFFPVAVDRVGKRDCWTKDVLCRVNMEDEVNNAHVT